MVAMMGRSMVEYHAYDSVYDNSGAFDKYLVKYGMEPALQHWKLKRKLKHTIVPHVCALHFVTELNMLLTLFYCSDCVCRWAVLLPLYQNSKTRRHGTCR